MIFSQCLMNLLPARLAGVITHSPIITKYSRTCSMSSPRLKSLIFAHSLIQIILGKTSESKCRESEFCNSVWPPRLTSDSSLRLCLCSSDLVSSRGSRPLHGDTTCSRHEEIWMCFRCCCMLSVTDRWNNSSVCVCVTRWLNAPYAAYLFKGFLG